MACPDVYGPIVDPRSSPGQLDPAEDAEYRDPVWIITDGEAARFYVVVRAEDALEFLQELHESLGGTVLGAV